MWLKARDTLCRIVDMAEEEKVTFTLENLNLPVDHPGVPFARAEDTLALVFPASITRACASTSTSTMRRSARGT